MDKEKEGLKPGEEETPEGDDLPEEKTTEPEDEGQGEKTPEKTSEEEVKVSRTELEQLRKDAGRAEELRKAVIRLNKARGRVLPGSEPEKKPEPKVDEFGEPVEPKEEYVTKKEMLQRENRQVISEACKNPEVDENWDEIIVYYIPPRENTYEAKLEAITKAHKLWSLDRKAGEAPKEEDKGKKATTELAAEKGLSKGKEKEPEAPKKSILPKRQKMSEWFNN